MRVRILAEAETEAQKAAEWYEKERSGIGFDFLDALSRALRAIERTPLAFAKVNMPRSNREVRRIVMPPRQQASRKAAPASLNISTYIALATYGYTNIYELGPLLDVATTKLPFEGAEVQAAK